MDGFVAVAPPPVMLAATVRLPLIALYLTLVSAVGWVEMESVPMMRAGDVLLEIVPSPSWLYPFCPQVYWLPPLKATVWS
jgi:hypothetical protein